MIFNKTMILILLSLITTTCFGQTTVDSVFISDVRYRNDEFSNHHAGSGFLVKYKGKTYACTAKHVLSFAKTDEMKTVSFGDDLASWTLASKNNPDVKIAAGKLINENPEESIVMPPLGDWLIFEVKGTVPKNVAVYKLSKKDLKKGDPVTILGYPYKSEGAIRVVGSYAGLTEDQKGYTVEAPEGNYAGTSGGPILDQNGKLIGLVSMGFFDEEKNKMILEPAPLDYFLQVMKNLRK